jgi:hypothetical protein
MAASFSSPECRPRSRCPSSASRHAPGSPPTPNCTVAPSSTSPATRSATALTTGDAGAPGSSAGGREECTHAVQSAAVSVRAP